MALRVISGRAGVGKTHFMEREIMNAVNKEPLGAPIFMVVPDQMSFSSERNLTWMAGESRGTIRVQVTSFKRLAWRILQEAGGISRQELNGFGYRMLLKSVLEENKDKLRLFGKAADKRGFTEEMEQIKKLCERLEKPISIVNGQTKDLENYKFKDNTVVLVQYQAGAMGLNLQKSNKIIYYSLPLASELFEQSKKRTHRIGQTRTCIYWYLLTKGSIEEEIFKTLKERRDYTNKLFEELEEI